MHFRIVHSAQFCVWYEKCQLIGAVGIFELYFLSISFMTNKKLHIHLFGNLKFYSYIFL